MKPIFFLLALLIWGCEFKRMDTSGMAREMKDRKIKHVTPSQLTTLADLWGSRIAQQLNQDFPTSMQDPAQIDSLEKAYGATIRFETFEVLNRADLDPKAREVYEAYQYTARQRQVADPNVQKLQNGADLLYTAPVVFSPEISTRWQALSDRERQALTQQFGLNPADTSGTGKFLGLWSMTFPRKELILRVDAKDLKKLDVRP